MTVVSVHLGSKLCKLISLIVSPYVLIGSGAISDSISSFAFTALVAEVRGDPFDTKMVWRRVIYELRNLGPDMVVGDFAAQAADRRAAFTVGGAGFEENFKSIDYGEAVAHDYRGKDSGAGNMEDGAELGSE